MKTKRQKALNITTSKKEFAQSLGMDRKIQATTSCGGRRQNLCRLRSESSELFPQQTEELSLGEVNLALAMFPEFFNNTTAMSSRHEAFTGADQNWSFKEKDYRHLPVVGDAVELWFRKEYGLCRQC